MQVHIIDNTTRTVYQCGKVWPEVHVLASTEFKFRSALDLEQLEQLPTRSEFFKKSRYNRENKACTCKYYSRCTSSVPKNVCVRLITVQARAAR